MTSQLKTCIKKDCSTGQLGMQGDVPHHLDSTRIYTNTILYSSLVLSIAANLRQELIGFLLF
jgi:hypothetical protein